MADWCSHMAEWHGSANVSYPTALEETRCLLCNESLFNEMMHFKRRHWQRGQFDAPFRCPECSREGADAILIEDGEKWKLHCATVHGSTVPMVPTAALKSSRKRSRCLICDRVFSSLSQHITKSHEARGDFNQPFPCPECARTSNTEPPPRIEGRQAWMVHCASVHTGISSVASPEGQSIDCEEAREATKGSDGGKLLAKEAEGLLYEKGTRKKRKLGDDELAVIVPTKKQRVGRGLQKEGARGGE